MKKSLRTAVLILSMIAGSGVLLLFLFIMGFFLMMFMVSGGCSNHPIPPDEELIRNFMAHEADFDAIKDFALKLEDGNYYPPFDRTGDDERDKSCDKWLTQEERDRLDSLLKVVNCERIYYRGRANYRGVAADSGMTLTYWARGLSIGGTWKEYRYRPDFERMTHSGDSRIYTGKETGDLLEISNYADTIVYKPIKGEWYIEFGHDN